MSSARRRRGEAVASRRSGRVRPSADLSDKPLARPRSSRRRDSRSTASCSSRPCEEARRLSAKTEVWAPFPRIAAYADATAGASGAESSSPSGTELMPSLSDVKVASWRARSGRAPSHRTPAADSPAPRVQPAPGARAYYPRRGLWSSYDELRVRRTPAAGRAAFLPRTDSVSRFGTRPPPSPRRRRSFRGSRAAPPRRHHLGRRSRSAARHRRRPWPWPNSSLRRPAYGSPFFVTSPTDGGGAMRWRVTRPRPRASGRPLPAARADCPPPSRSGRARGRDDSRRWPTISSAAARLRHAPRRDLAGAVDVGRALADGAAARGVDGEPALVRVVHRRGA